MLLEKIDQVGDIKKLSPEDYPVLAKEIRDYLITITSEKGGHLGSNLGVVELTMALHLSLNLPEDKLIFDVGHQSYTHKLLSGRREDFLSLRAYGGLSGFPKHRESECDPFDTGHSSTSISAGLGFVRARELTGEKYTVVSVIGDGALTGGLAYEGLNNASRLETNFIIVLNDNAMSISENVGGIPKYLQSIRTASGYQAFKANLEDFLLKSMPNQGEKVLESLKRFKSSFKQLLVPGMLFEDMGITYLGPVDGHDIKDMMRTFREAKKIRHAVLIHVLTKKGMGYPPAERHPARFHGIGPFDIETGVPVKKSSKANYTDIFSTVMMKLAARQDNIVAVTAAMPDGTGLKRFRNRYPQRFFDVGIAEGHAVTFAAGLAAGGLLPVVAVYSSFLQRAYDQILHDVCLQGLHVVFAVDRAGLVGADGETHQGIFDLSYLSSIPHLIIMAPKNKWELSDMLKFAVAGDQAAAIRYPRGEAWDGLKEKRAPMELGKGEWIEKEKDILLFALGSMVKTGAEVRELLKEKGYSCSLVNARFMQPLDEELLLEAARDHSLIVSLEENVARGGFGEKIASIMKEKAPGTGFLPISLPNEYVEQGNVEELKRHLGVDAESIAKKILKFLS